MNTIIQITATASEQDKNAVRALFIEYMDWTRTFLGDPENVPAFESWSDELANIPGIYAPPKGCLLLAYQDAIAAGCVAYKQVDQAVCELKRLYVPAESRGAGIGFDLVKTLIDHARQAGYSRMVLDSHHTMKKAHAVYHSLGFKTVDAPPHFPPELRPIVVFMELDLRPAPR